MFYGFSPPVPLQSVYICSSTLTTISICKHKLSIIHTKYEPYMLNTRFFICTCALDCRIKLNSHKTTSGLMGGVRKKLIITTESPTGIYCCFWKLFFREKLQQLCLPRISLSLFSLEKGGIPGFFPVGFVVDIE